MTSPAQQDVLSVQVDDQGEVSKPYAAEVDHHHAAPAATGQDFEQIDPGYWRSPRFLGTCAAIVFAANSLFFGYAVPVNILDVIDADIGPSANISLVTLFSTLCQGVFFLLMGSISDQAGRRYWLIAGCLAGLIGAIIAATAKDVNQVIGSSVLTGFAAAIQISYPLLSMEIVPNKYRGWAQGLVTLTALPSMGFGPIVGRTIVTNVVGGWRFCFWVAAIVNGMAFILFTLFYFPPTLEDLHEDTTALQEFLGIDWAGFAMYCGSIVCLLLALTWGGQSDPWSSGKIIALLVVGCVGLAIFFCYEIFVPLRQPVIPVSLFKIRNYWVMVIIGSVAQMAYYALNVFLPTQTTALWSTDNATIGWISSITGIALALGEIILGVGFKMIGHVRFQLMFAISGLCIFCGVMSLANDQHESLGIGATAMIGFFVGWIELASLVSSTLVVPPEEIGVAMAFFGSTRAVTGTVAVSVYLAIFDGRIAVNMGNMIPAAALDAGLPSSSMTALLTAVSNGTAAAFETVPGITPSIITAVTAALKAAYSASFGTVYLSSLAFGGTALVASFFVTDVDQYLTSFVNKTVAGRQAPRDQKEAEKV